MDFTGKICPYCKTEFKEGDDVVVCSVCETPHHRECWIENKACTTFGCTGTIVGAESHTEAVDNKRFCSKCGKPLSENQKFCTGCGTPVNGGGAPAFSAAGAAAYAQPAYQQAQPQGYQAPNQPTYPQGTYQQGYQQMNAGDSFGDKCKKHFDMLVAVLQKLVNTNETYQSAPQNSPDFMAFVQKNQYKYAQKFNAMFTNNKKISWNWCGFLFGGMWLAYRKMYAAAVAYTLASSIFVLIPGLGGLLQMALWVCVGLFGNYMYKEHMNLHFTQAQCLDVNAKQAYNAKNGGTSAAAIWAIIGVSLVFSIIISLF